MPLEANIISPFAMGTIEVFKVQVGVPITVGVSYRVPFTEVYSGDITGEIKIRSDVFLGQLAISFPEKTYLATMSKLLGDTFTTITPEIRDGASEFANMIFGHGKRLLTERGKKLEMAIPSLVYGRVAPNFGMRERFRVEFESGVGKFALDIMETGG